MSGFPPSAGNAHSPREAVRYLVFSASLRVESLNTTLARLAAESVQANGGDVDLASMREFDSASYDADVQQQQGFPAGAEMLHRRLQACDAFVVSSPEYNNSMPGALKNAIDWVSRYHPQPFYERHGLLLSASPSMVGGNRGLWALRVPFEHLGARLYPDMFSLAQAHNAFTGMRARSAGSQSTIVATAVSAPRATHRAARYPRRLAMTATEAAAAPRHTVENQPASPVAVSPARLSSAATTEVTTTSLQGIASGGTVSEVMTGCCPSRVAPNGLMVGSRRSVSLVDGDDHAGPALDGAV